MDKLSFARAGRRSRDRLVRLMVCNWIFGVLVGLAWAGILLAFNFAGLRGLILRSDIAGWGLVLLFGGFAETFGGVVCATAIMILPMENEAD